MSFFINKYDICIGYENKTIFYINSTNRTYTIFLDEISFHESTAYQQLSDIIIYIKLNAFLLSILPCVVFKKLSFQQYILQAL